MKRLFLFISFLSIIFISAQKLSKEEVRLIKLGEHNQAMRVLQVTDKEDFKVLKSMSRPISPKDKNVKLLSDRMLATMIKEKGVGIAAPQVGLNVQAIWVKRFDKENNPFEFFINPKLEWMSSALRLGSEGCLSIPNERGDVFRSLVIELTYETLAGEKRRELIEGFTAVIFQHEYDHLVGKLFTERIEEQSKKSFIKSDEVNKIYYQEF